MANIEGGIYSKKYGSHLRFRNYTNTESLQLEKAVATQCSNEAENNSAFHLQVHMGISGCFHKHSCGLRAAAMISPDLCGIITYPWKQILKRTTSFLSTKP